MYNCITPMVQCLGTRLDMALLTTACPLEHRVSGWAAEPPPDSPRWSWPPRTARRSAAERAGGGQRQRWMKRVCVLCFSALTHLQGQPASICHHDWRSTGDLRKMNTTNINTSVCVLYMDVEYMYMYVYWYMYMYNYTVHVGRYQC